MGIKTAGQLRPMQYIVESSYGTVPSGQLKYGGKMQGQDPVNNFEIETFGADGSRVVEITAFGKKESGFKAELGIYKNSGTYSWTDLLELAIGGPSEARADIDSFSTLIQAASDQFYLYRGCKVNTFSLNGAGVGAPVIASMDVLSMICDEPKSTKAALLSNADATVPALNPVTHNAYPIISASGGITVPAMSFTYSFGNNLVQKEGIVNGVALKAGSLMFPGDLMDIGIEYTVPSTSLVWDKLKLAATSGFTVTHDVGGYRLVFSGCWFTGSDMPSRSQSGYDENLSIKASNVTWTAI